MTATDGNICGPLPVRCTFDIKVICDYCPIDVYYEGRAPEENPLPTETVAGGSISAGFNVDPAQQNGFVWTGNEDVLFRAPVINLESGFTGGPGFQAIIDPNTCLEDCNDCCTNWSGFTVDTYAEGNTNVFEYPFSPNGDGVNDVWQVLDMDNAYCAYGATSFTLWISSRWGGEPVWLLFGFSPTCCQFDSWAPDRPGVVSSIYWDGTVNFGTWQDHGEYVPSTEYVYILDLYGCGGALAHYTGYIGVFDSPGPSGMMLQDSIPTAQSSDSRPQPSVQPEHAVALGGGPTPPAFFVAPNPASDFVFVEYGTGLSILRIFDTMGRSVREVSPANATHHLLDVSALASGTYVLRALATDGSIHQRTLIKQ